MELHNQDNGCALNGRIDFNEKMRNKETLYNTDGLDDADDFMLEIQMEDERTSVNASLDGMDVSPMKLPSHSKDSYGKRKGA